MGLSCSASLEQLAVDLEHHYEKVFFFMECCKQLPCVFLCGGGETRKAKLSAARQSEVLCLRWLQVCCCWDCFSGDRVS